MPHSFRHTKIVCTLGPASLSPAVLTRMVKSGMNIARINFSHGSQEDNVKIIGTIRDVAEKTGHSVAILQDLQGPKIRIGEVLPEGIVLEEGKIVTLQAGLDKSLNEIIPVPYRMLAKAVQPDERILLDDGTKELRVLSVKGQMIQAKVLLGGTLLSRKGITVPGVSLVNKAITPKDEADLAFGLQHRIDFIAMSFIRTADDVKQLKILIQKYLPKNTPGPNIIAKIEKPEALENFEEILEEVDGVMVARGDLGLETPISQVPLHQKKIIRQCMAAHKTVITATEMLGSMQYNPRPTRAEVSDVANATFDQTDAVMLSGETAMGKYPVRVVETMAEIIHNSEAVIFENSTPVETKATEDDQHLIIGQAAINLAQRLGVKALVVITRSGFFARIISSMRPPIPIIALTDKDITTHQLLLNWGVTPILVPSLDSLENSLQKSMLKTLPGKFKKGDQIVILSDLKPKIEAIEILEI